MAIKWFATLKVLSRDPLQALSVFLDRFMVQQGLPTNPDMMLRKETTIPDFYGTACPRSRHGVKWNNHIRAFLEFVLAERYSHLDPITGLRSLDTSYWNPVPKRDFKTFEIIPDRPKGLNRTTDQNFGWVQDKYPQLEPWRLLSSEWIQGPGAQNGGIDKKLWSLSLFLERYIIRLGLPVAPPRLLQRNIQLPSFLETCCPKSRMGFVVNNYVHDFLEFVLLKECSEKDDYGDLVVSSEFKNPVPRERASGKAGRRGETNKVPLPYGYITRLRRQLIGGQDFRDWIWAQQALGTAEGASGTPAPDWYRVTWDQIDKDDPDCVWRIRKVWTGEILEMWSPVRWVALAFKLLLPLRTFQVRMLDSGEGDTYRYDSGDWGLNYGPLAAGRPGASVHQGFLYRSLEQDGTVMTQLYANTNKTADILKSGNEKGFVFPWIVFGDPLDDVFYWAEKLRNWQEKYNPIYRLTSWTELDGTRIPGKSAAQLAGYSDTAFLFRMREESPAKRQFPLQETVLENCWFRLLFDFEERLAGAGETLKNGGRIRFVPAPEERRKKSNATKHPLHSLRVSLITALVLDGKVPIETMQKVVGHSRLLMTIYYIVHGETIIRLSLEEAAKKLEASAEASCEEFLKNTEMEELLKTAICVDLEGIKAAIAVAPGERHPVGWMMMADGCCLMGGNTSPAEGNAQIGGCYNGGADIPGTGNRSFGPVPGGPRNCVRCRWFVTMPQYFFALVRRLNNLFYEKAKEQELVLGLHETKRALEAERVDAERRTSIPFDRAYELEGMERRYESAVARLDVIIANIFACVNLIIRCEIALNQLHEGMGLVTVGGAAEFRTRIDGIDSELLQLAQVCEDLELYPDLPSIPDAVLRRGQILDMVLMSEGFKPLFLTMTPEQQKSNGNAFMRELARRADPEDPIRGRVKVVTLMDLKMNLMEHLGFRLADCLPLGLVCEPMDTAYPIKINTNGSRNVLHN
ncbi:MAG: hypothetical protein LWW79_09995 [Holophagaceae bacterium]|nr:hypothetical protein [Holophagaceae bacterium]